MGTKIVMKDIRPKRRMPWSIGKTISVKTKSPFFLIVEYETGEKRILDLEGFIENDSNLLPLKTEMGLFEKAEISLCGYMTEWMYNGYNCYFHNDIVFVYGDDYIEND